MAQSPQPRIKQTAMDLIRVADAVLSPSQLWKQMDLNFKTFCRQVRLHLFSGLTIPSKITSIPPSVEACAEFAKSWEIETALPN
jgi:hypothetical protein